MSNIDKQALRLTAEKAKDNFMPNFMVPTRDVLALLDELEAAEKRIAELEAREVRLTDINEYLAEVHDKTLNRAFRLLAGSNYRTGLWGSIPIRPFAAGAKEGRSALCL